MLRNKSTKYFFFLSTFFIFTSNLVFAQASDQRIIDVVSVTWAGAGPQPGTVNEVRNEIDNDVKSRWQELTRISGDAQDRSIEFVSGQILLNPIVSSLPLPCERVVTAWSDGLREEAYKRLGINDSQSRYLVIVTPANGCIWSGLANIGNASQRGGTLILHNTTKGFVIAHELGHLLGLGHSNLIRCPNSSADGSWNVCRAVEYGGSVDLMSNVDVKTPLSTYHQWRMGLLAKEDVIQSWKSETVEINPVDIVGKPRAIFLREGSSTYWIEYRNASDRYKSGLVIYRTDPPPGSSVISPNPADAVQNNSLAIGTDIWMLNLENYTYTERGASSIGSMSLPFSQKLFLQSGKVSIKAEATNANSVLVTIERNINQTPGKPLFSAISSWNSQDSSILSADFILNTNGVEEFEIKRDDQRLLLLPSSQKNWNPTYLDPFQAPKLPTIHDLPEGQYNFSIRVRDKTGFWSDWSETAKVNIDRGYPLVGENLEFQTFSSRGIETVLKDFKDMGSGLCLTQLVNQDGWVVARSLLRTSPTLMLSTTQPNSLKVETFDCLGNGQQGNLKASITLKLGSSLSKRGTWLKGSSEYPDGSTQCVKSCLATMVVQGQLGIIVGKGNITYQLPNSKPQNFSSKVVDGTYSVLTVSSKERKTLRISGKDFVIIGTLKGKLSLGNISNTQRLSSYLDSTLDDPIQKRLSTFGFTSEDFSSDWTVLPMAKGTTLEDPSLDLCSADYPSEVGRQDRRQVVATRRGSPYLFLSSEVVRYKSGTSAGLALAELKDRFTKCIQNGGGTERGGAFVKYKFLELPKIPDGLGDLDSKVIAYATIGEGDSTRTLLAIYQFQGPILSGLYIVRDKNSSFDSDEVARWLEASSILAQRIQVTKS